jgi:hypothetical protein
MTEPTADPDRTQDLFPSPVAVAPATFTLAPRAIVEMAERGQHFLEAHGGFGDVRTAWIPLADLSNPNTVRDHLANRFGYLSQDKDDPEVKKLISAAKQPLIPRVSGTSRLGWTIARDAFVYDGTVFYVSKPPKRSYEFVAPDGTLIRRAVDALTPRGERSTQYGEFRKLWPRSWEFRLILSLATVSPFLEALNAPPIACHLAGPSGVGKTTLLRLAGIAPYADPDSPLTKIDFSKDTQNYADAQLGILHNFPLLLDETTLRDSGQIAEAAYNIAVGRTKGRLTGPEQNYLPAEPLAYTLVCFLSGEASIREQIDQRGGAARLLEIVSQRPLLSKTELPKYWAFAKEHYGWYGRDLLDRVIRHHFADGKDGQKLQDVYSRFRRDAAPWCRDHSRMLDAIAATQLGFYLATRLLFDDFAYLRAGDHSQLLEDSSKFAREVYAQINKTTKADEVMAAIRELSRASEWAQRGFIPPADLDLVAREFEMDRSRFTQFLRNQGIVQKIEPRKIEGQSVRCYVLSEEGKRRLAKRSRTTGTTTPTRTGNAQ